MKMNIYATVSHMVWMVLLFGRSRAIRATLDDTVIAKTFSGEKIEAGTEGVHFADGTTQCTAIPPPPTAHWLFYDVVGTTFTLWGEGLVTWDRRYSCRFSLGGKNYLTEATKPSGENSLVCVVPESYILGNTDVMDTFTIEMLRGGDIVPFFGVEQDDSVQLACLAPLGTSINVAPNCKSIRLFYEQCNLPLSNGAFFILPNTTEETNAMELFCDFDAFGGDWTLIGKLYHIGYLSWDNQDYINNWNNPVYHTDLGSLKSTTFSSRVLGFLNKNFTDSLYNEGEHKILRVDWIQDLGNPANQKTYFMRRITHPVEWSLFEAIRDSGNWGYGPSMAGTGIGCPTDSYVDGVNGNSLLGEESTYDPATNTYESSFDGTLNCGPNDHVSSGTESILRSDGMLYMNTVSRLLGVVADLSGSGQWIFHTCTASFKDDQGSKQVLLWMK